MRALFNYFAVCLPLVFIPFLLKAGTSPCSATNYQASDFGITKDYTLDNGTFMDLPDPSCGDYQGDDFWVTFIGPASGMVNAELIPGSILDGAFEIYWNACNGLATSIGCFSNRNCGAEPMPGAILDVIPGETYHVRIYQEGGGGGTLGFRMSDLGGTDFALAGSAEVFNSGVPNQNCIELTSETQQQVGCAWFETPIDFASGFEINYQLYFGTIDGNGADGIAFVFHTDPSPPCASTGGQLGVVGIANSFIVEFDTWRNGNFGDTTPDDHVAINIDGILGTLPIVPPVSIGTNGNVEDGLWHDVTLTWDPMTNLFQVFFDGDLKISQNVATLTNIFAAGTPVYWGLTGSTGAAFNNQRFCFDGFTVENSNSVENNISEKICAGAPYVFGSTVIFDEGEYVDVFEAANGCDSTVTLTLELVEIAITGTEEFVLPCDDDNSEIQISASVDSNTEEAFLDYEWETDNGVIDSGANTLTPMVSAVGTYTLTVEYSPENCEEVFVVEVSNAEPPLVEASGGFLCGSDTILISCNGDEGVLVSWSTLDGNIVGDPNVPTPMVDTAGTYIVTVTDIATGCTSTSQTSVMGPGEGDPGPDLFYCLGSDGELTLQGTVTEGVVAFEWSPPINLSNPREINPTVSNLPLDTMSYELIVCNRVGQNLVVNGDFSEGISDFTTDYDEGVAAPGRYLVTDEPTEFFPSFAACDDHSPEDENMMVVDGSVNPDENFWCQEVEVEDGGDYVVAAWFTYLCNNCNDNFPEISFLVDGVRVNDGQPNLVDAASCEWIQLESNVFIASSTTVEICISDLELSSNGNDFAIDDIDLYAICKTSAGECSIIPYDEIDILTSQFFACEEDEIVDIFAGVENNGSDGNFSYSWETTQGGEIFNSDSLFAQVVGQGVYNLTVVDEDTGCSSQDSIFVDYDLVTIDYELISTPITCANGNSVITINNLVLDPDETSFIMVEGPDTTFSSLSPMLNLSYSVETPGVYTVTVYDSLLDACGTEQSITVEQIDAIPDVTIDPISALTCKDLEEGVELNGMYTTSSGDPASVEWNTLDGEVVSTMDNNALVSGVGTYIFTVTNTVTGCTNSQEITLESDIAPPVASIIAPNNLDCVNPSTSIQVEEPVGADYTYSWTSDVTGFNNDSDANAIEVGSAGTYDVIVTDNVTGCTTMLNTSVSENFELPSYAVGPAPLLDCNTDQVDLSILSTDPNTILIWTPNNNIISGLNSNTVTVNADGSYEVFIVNTFSGCEESETIIVSSNFAEPDVEAGNPLTFGCDDISLDLLGSSTSPNASIEWQTAGGVLISGQDSFAPSIGGAGTYFLTVTGENGCTSRDSVVVGADTDLPVIIAPETISLNCANPSAIIDATGSSADPDITFVWEDASGNVISDFTTLDPSVSEAGQYQLILTNTQNGCQSNTFVNVVDDFQNPMPNITPVLDLSCDETSSTFGAELNNPDWSYTWSFENQPITGANQFQLEAEEVGMYTLTVFNQLNGCSNDFPFQLDSDISGPELNFVGPDELSCTESEIEVSAETNIANVTFSWLTAGGNILSSTEMASIQLNGAGTYSVTITDTDTGCTAEDEFVVTQDDSLPIIDIAPPANLTCDIADVMLIATVDNIGTDVDFIWSTDDGILSSPNGATNITAGSAGEYTLTVFNNENGCESTSSISVGESISTFIVEIEDPAVLDCDITEFELSAEEIIGANVSYAWTSSDGNIVSGEDTVNPLINQSGEYILLISDLDNGCTAQSSVTVSQDGNVPEIQVENPGQITCDDGQVLLDATGSSDGVEFLIEWSTIDGNILNGENGLTPQVDMSGSYLLSITNLSNNCKIDQAVIVELNTDLPELEILPFNSIDCDNSTVQITSSVLNGATNLSYEWSGINGVINGTMDQESIEIASTGDYNLLVTNLDNGCTNDYSFSVTGNDNVPQVAILPAANIDCDNSNIFVSLDLPTDTQNLVYSWATPDGMINGALDESEIETNTPGTYQVTVTDVQSNCEVILSTLVEDVAEVPNLDYIVPNIITCTDLRSVINTQTTTNGLFYEWSTIDGTITSQLNGEDVVVSSAGTYVLVVTNAANNCDNSISVEVFEDIDLPEIDLQPALSLNCLLTEQSLSAEGSSMGPEFDYQWTSQNGQIVSGETSLSPLISAPGYYALEITNTENDCVISDSILIAENTVQPLAQVADPQDLDCATTIVELTSDLVNTDDLELVWTTSTGNIVSDSSDAFVEVDMPGVYDLEILDLTNGCTNLISVMVEEDTDAPILELSPGITLNCDLEESELSVLNVDSGASITWMDPQMNVLSNDENITVSEPGIYTAVALFAENGCETVTAVEVLANDNLPTELIADIEPALCFGDLASISIVEVVGGEGPYLYSTDSGQSFGDLPSLSDLSAGTLTEVVVQDVNGCTLATEFLIPELINTEADLPPLVELDLGENYQIQVQTNIPASDIETIVWTPNTGLSCTDCLNPQVSPASTIDYQVEITTINGCVENAAIQLRVDTDINVYIPNAFSPFNDDGVNDRFFVFAKEGLIATVQSLHIYDRWGNELFVNEDFAPNEAEHGWDGIFRQEKMQTGVYVYYALVEYFDGTTELFKGDLTLME